MRPGANQRWLPSVTWFPARLRADRRLGALGRGVNRRRKCQHVRLFCVRGAERPLPLAPLVLAAALPRICPIEDQPVPLRGTAARRPVPHGGRLPDRAAVQLPVAGLGRPGPNIDPE